MKLNSILQHLVSGELQRHSLANGLVGNTLNVEHLDKVIPMLNLGLLDICSRFVVNQKEVLIDLYENITTYVLDSRFAVTNTASTEPVKYIHDSIAMPFEDDVIKILSIHNEMGQERFINDNNRHWSLHLINYNTIQHPYPDEENTISVIYQPKFKDIVVTPTFDPTEIDIELPPYLLRALLYFVAARVHIGLNKQEAQAESNNYNGLYEAQLMNVEKHQMIRSDDHFTDHFDNNGYV
jgi:hypothetical protein